MNDIIITRTQHDAQLWNDLLRATGGALNLDKQKKYIPTLLNKIGLARTHAQVLVFDPRSYIQNFPQDQLGKESSG